MILGCTFSNSIALYLMLASNFFSVRHPVRLLVYLMFFFFQNVRIRMDAWMSMEIWRLCGLRLQVFSQLGEISLTHIDLSFYTCL